MSTSDTLLFAFNQGSKAVKAARDICTVYGEVAIAERSAHGWYTKFKNGNFYFKDAPRSGRPVIRCVTKFSRFF